VSCGRVPCIDVDAFLVDNPTCVDGCLVNPCKCGQMPCFIGVKHYSARSFDASWRGKSSTKQDQLAEKGYPARLVAIPARETLQGQGKSGPKAVLVSKTSALAVASSFIWTDALCRQGEKSLCLSRITL